MVHDQLERRGIQDRRVLDAMAQVPREEFVPAAWHHRAYADTALPIRSGQTISQPFTVGFMCEAAKIAEGSKVLEIGTGSGYGAAVLSLLAREVHTVEHIPSLAQQADERLQRLGYHNVHVHIGDGVRGLPEEAPFDAMVVTAGGQALPKRYVGQLKEGGRIIIPLGRTTRRQTMYRLTLQGKELQMEKLGGFAFVPLIGADGGNE